MVGSSGAMQRLKNDKLDKVFSRIVRESHEWTCAKCGKRYERGSQGLHCSHIFSRRCLSTRWLPSNAVAHCFYCHQWYGGNPVLGGEWAQDYLGAEKLESLKRRFHQTMKLSKADKEEIYENLKGTLRALEEERFENNRTGYIQVDSPYPGYRYDTASGSS